MGLTTFNSPAFSNEDLIPVRFTEDGANISPSLTWRRVPARKIYLTALVTVLGAPQPEVRWLLYNVLEFTGPIREGMVPASGAVGLNAAGNAAWWGPDAGQQRTLVFALYASDAPIEGDCPLSWYYVELQLAEQNVAGPFTFRAYYPAVPRGTIR